MPNTSANTLKISGISVSQKLGKSKSRSGPKPIRGHTFGVRHSLWNHGQKGPMSAAKKTFNLTAAQCKTAAVAHTWFEYQLTEWAVQSSVDQPMHQNSVL
jgi:hypothetical protein